MSFALRRTPDATVSSTATPAARTAVVADGSMHYVGLVTRAIAFALDSLILNIVAVGVAAVVALAISALSLPSWFRTAVVAAGGVIYVLWVVGYFVTFWATTGQTPGDRVLRIRVLPASGGSIKPRRALLRFIGIWLAALPFFTGFLIILIDDRRRGLQDFLARTVVVEAEEKAAAADTPRRGGRPAR